MQHYQAHRDITSFDQTDQKTNANSAGDWAVPWSDLMMVMFVLFVVLFIYASNDKDVEVLFSQQTAERVDASSSFDPLIGLIGRISASADEGSSEEFVRLVNDRPLYKSRVDGVSVVRESGGDIRITLRGELFFDKGQADMNLGAENYLSEIGELLKQRRGAIHVVGYASEDEGMGGNGFAVSTSRAVNVADSLMLNFGIGPERIILSGRGAHQPELPATSPENRALNRRVDIVITNNS